MVTVLPSAVLIVIESAVTESTVPSMVGAPPNPNRPPLPLPPLPAPGPKPPLGSKLALGPPLVKNRPPPGVITADCDAAAGAVDRPSANATPAVATRTATPSATLRIDADPDRRAGFAAAAAGAAANAGAAAWTGIVAGIGSGAAGWNAGGCTGAGWAGGSNAGSAGTGSVGEASADGFDGSMGVVMPGVSYS